MSVSTSLRGFVLVLSLAAAGLAAHAVQGNFDDQPVVHLVVIGDLNVGSQIEKDGNIKYSDFGMKVAEDATNIITTFESAFIKAGKANQLKTHLILGKEVTPGNVLGVVAKLPVKKNDALVVFYSGHGQMEPGQKHVLTFHHGDLTRQRLLDAIKAKNPRLMVLFTDCCSGGIAGRSLVKQYEPKAMKDGEVMEWSTVNSLFLRHNGLVDLTAAEPGFCGKIDLNKPGSLLTNAFVRVLKTPYSELIRHLDKDGDGHLQWDEFLPQLRGLAAQYDRQQLRDLGVLSGRDLSDVAPQQAYATSLGRWMPVSKIALP